MFCIYIEISLTGSGFCTILKNCFYCAKYLQCEYLHTISALFQNVLKVLPVIYTIIVHYDVLHLYLQPNGKYAIMIIESSSNG